MPLEEEQLRKMATMRITASLSPFEVTIINVMRKRNYGQLTVFFQRGIPVRFESVDSSLIFDSEDGKEVLGKIFQKT